MKAKSFNLTVQGASHIKKNKECQDASACYQDENCAIAIVCDGHGGDDYVRSAIGSKFGCDVAEQNIKNFILGTNKEKFFSNPDKLLKYLEASIINGWNESITEYHNANPFSEKELSVVSDRARKKYLEKGRIESAYGTTMIAVAMNHDYWFGIHIGDGKCVAINPAGEFKQPIPWDPKCFLNATTSICDSDAIDRFRHFYSEKLPAAVFVGSDGIDDCFSNNEQLHNLYKTVLYSFATTDFEEARDGLADYLPRLSAKGSGDDVSVAAILDMNLIPELPIVKEFDREKEKARVEENARKEAERNEAEKRRVAEEHARFQKLNNAKSPKPARGNPPKFCENCGERIRPGVKFCSNCGSKIIYRKPEEKTKVDPEDEQIIELKSISSKNDIETVEHIVDPQDIQKSSESASKASIIDDEPKSDIVEDIEDIELSTDSYEESESEKAECEITAANAEESDTDSECLEATDSIPDESKTVLTDIVGDMHNDNPCQIDTIVDSHNMAED